MKAINRKLLRDLWQMKSQVVTIALVVAAGMAGFIGSISTYDSLQSLLSGYYDQARFAQVFAELKRAPRSVEQQIARIPGVADAETTVAFDVTLDMQGVNQPVIGRFIGLANADQPRLNQVFVRLGRMIEAGRAGEVVITEGFAKAHALPVGAQLAAVLNGKRQSFQIVGIGLSPEYVYGTAGGAFPDDRGFGVLWLDRSHLAAAYNMEGAFNRVAIRLTPGGTERAVIDQLDQLLEPYGGLRSYGRVDQVSNKIISQEIDQQKVMGTTLPIPFFGVAAFLLNVVLARIVATQREQIAALKALGYDNADIAMHYLKFVLLIVLVGMLFGVGFGVWFGSYMTAMYANFFHFPHLTYRLEPWIAVTAAAICLVAAVAGALATVRQVVQLAPAEAMRPPHPPRYKKILLERLGLAHWLSPATRMVVRNLERRPLRALITVAGIASAVGVLISGTFWNDSINDLIDTQFRITQVADADVALIEPTERNVLQDVGRLPGVTQAEGARYVPVKLQAGHRSYRTAIQGLPQHAQLRRLLDEHLRDVTLPPDGLLLTDRLAQRLGVRAGDTLWVETLQGKRRQRAITVAGTVGELVGMSVYMDMDALSRLMGEAPSVSSVAVALDRTREADFFAATRNHPRIATVASKTAMLKSFQETSAKNILFFTTVFTGFAAVIAFGVVYNAARITLAERAWELASLRVLGFTRREVSVFMLGELAVEIAIGIPLGLPFGYFLAWGLLSLMPHETIKLPVVIYAATYAYAALAILVAGLVSALVVRRRIDRLDMVSVLKTRE
ncbi:MAG: FtsX-like permease family protein [Burkholderiaceae bacterium]